MRLIEFVEESLGIYFSIKNNINFCSRTFTFKFNIKVNRKAHLVLEWDVRLVVREINYDQNVRSTV